jgi:hypothetical protein
MYNTTFWFEISLEKAALETKPFVEKWILATQNENEKIKDLSKLILVVIIQ